MAREVVVTGLGMVSPVGKNVADGWDALVAGRSGIGTISRFDTSDYDYPIGGEVDDFDPADYVDAKLRRRIDISTAFAIVGQSLDEPMTTPTRGAAPDTLSA